MRSCGPQVDQWPGLSKRRVVSPHPAPQAAPYPAPPPALYVQSLTFTHSYLVDASAKPLELEITAPT